MSNHVVVVDTALIEATYERYAGQVLTGDYLPGQDQAETDTPGADPEAWNDEAQMLVMFASSFFPNWEIPDERLESLAEAVAKVARHYLPGGGPNVKSWGPFQQLGYEVARVGVYAVDPATLTLKPAKAAPPPESGQDQEQGREKSKGAYTTGGYDSDE